MRSLRHSAQGSSTGERGLPQAVSPVDEWNDSRNPHGISFVKLLAK